MAAADQVRSTSEPKDLRAVVDLAQAGRLEPGEPQVLLRHLSMYLGATGRLLVADGSDGKVAGFVMLREVAPHLFADAPGVVIDSLFVDPAERRRGLGHALVAEVATLAAADGAPYVYASPPTGDRGMQRFLARLGFAPSAGNRVVPTPTLLRRLGAVPGAATAQRRARVGTRAALDELIARRRRARSGGLPTGALDLRGVPSRSDHRPES